MLCPLRRVASGVGEKPVKQGAESLLWSSICRPAVPEAGVWEEEGVCGGRCAGPGLAQGWRANAIPFLLVASYVLAKEFMCLNLFNPCRNPVRWLL